MPEVQDVIFKPKELYSRELKRQYHDAATEYFIELAKKSGINPEENLHHVDAYKEAQQVTAAAKKKLDSIKGLKVFLIIMTVLFFVAAAVLIFLGIYKISQWWWLIIIGGASLILGILFIVLLKKRIAATLAKRKAAYEEALENEKHCLDVCYADMAPLNASFDWNIPAIVMEATTPIIDLDPIFDNRRLEFLHKKFGMPYEGENTSVLGVLSGQIQGNPFLLEKVRNHEIRDKRYTGSITIHWTTTYRDKNGVHTQHHSQTLTASIDRPAPFYREETRLIYGNEAAPRLHFSRRPNSKSSSTGKERERYVAHRMGELTKKNEKDLKKNPSGHVFTPLGNDEFDVFFGAEDRDNEVEFRLLYTALAQRNVLDLLSDPKPYGDDFFMVKDGMVTSVASYHSQKFDYSANPDRFVGYDYKEMKARFVKYLDDYICSLFFDLAPLLSVPLYQMHSPDEYIFEEEYESNVNPFEQEAMANQLDPSVFFPDEAGKDLPLMLKALDTVKYGKADETSILSYSYQEIPRTEYVTKLGGDGRTHQVPVHWIEYIRVEKYTPMQIRKVGGSQPNYVKQIHEVGSRILSYLHGGVGHYERGLYALVNGQKPNDEAFGNLFPEDEKEQE